MQTLVIIIPQTGIADEACTELTKVLKGLGSDDHTLRFGSVQILKPRETGDSTVWICQMAVSYRSDEIDIPFATCKAVDTAIKSWALNLGFSPSIDFQLSRAYRIIN